MSQEFYIKAGSNLPYLRMELIRDGRYDFNKIYDALQDADVTFTMRDSETGILKVSNAKAEIVSEGGGCTDKHIIQYKWNTRDTKKPGIYEGEFTIHFNGNLSAAGIDYPSEGDLKMPITSKLLIYIV